MGSQQNPLYPTAESQRKLQPIPFAAGQTLSRDIPKDSVYKSFQLRLSGSIQTTYASGTPVSDAQSIFDNLVNRIEVVINGSRTVKSVRPHLLSIQQLMCTQITAERRSSAAALAAVDNFPVTDGGFVFGTTGQITTVAESLTLSFEMVYSEPGMGRESTWLNCKGVSSAEIKISTAAFSALQAFGNAAPVVYGSSTFIIDIITREAKDFDARLQLSDWRQTTKVVPFSSEQRNIAIDINKGQLLTGILLFAQDGAPGSATTATGKVPSNLLLTNISLILNGSNILKATDFKALQSENRSQYGIVAPFAGGISRLDGIAHLNMLRSRDLSTALSLQAPQVDNAQLVVDSNSAANVNYTTPATLTMMTEELVFPR